MTATMVSAPMAKRNQLASMRAMTRPLSITRIGPQIFYLMVFRSMAASAAHEISAAMRNAAARF